MTDEASLPLLLSINFYLFVFAKLLCYLEEFFIMTLSQCSSTETLKDPRVTTQSVDSSPNLSPRDEKDITVPSTPAESINLESQAPAPPPYHVFPRSRKLQLVCIVSLAAIFSPLSSNIYFPALSDISQVSQTQKRSKELQPNTITGA